MKNRQLKSYNSLSLGLNTRGAGSRSWVTLETPKIGKNRNSFGQGVNSGRIRTCDAGDRSMFGEPDDKEKKHGGNGSVFQVEIDVRVTVKEDKWVLTY